MICCNCCHCHSFHHSHRRGLVIMGLMGSAEPINFERKVLEPIKFEKIQLKLIFWYWMALKLGNFLISQKSFEPINSYSRRGPWLCCAKKATFHVVGQVMRQSVWMAKPNEVSVGVNAILQKELLLLLMVVMMMMTFTASSTYKKREKTCFRGEKWMLEPLRSILSG